MAAEPAIVCDGLTKRYGEGMVALRDLTLSVPRGASFALLGENGAGKSTLVRLLLGFIRPTLGKLRVLGEAHAGQVHGRVGYLHEQPVFEPRFSGREQLTHLAALSGLHDLAARRRIDELLERVHLTGAAERRSGTYSKGMLQRLAIAASLLTGPELLILDEPTSGLDPLAQYEMRQIMSGLQREGKTIFLCSHYLAEVEALCESVGILRHGRLVRSGVVSELLTRSDRVEIVLAEGESAEVLLARLELPSRELDAHGNRLRVAASDQAALLTALLAADVPIRSLNPVTETLEDLYVRVAGAQRQPVEPIPAGSERER
ncbi:MAG TPA: ABC transporter ATP-binding protein [Ktedonobacterales bacterium]|jgi:ABC-2 type transport system ATP-binding protein|nr:ABC transporter ATP-binding protein [Ktedonobacterales bacterium]